MPRNDDVETALNSGRASAIGLSLGRPRLHLAKTDSTNERARELALAGAPHGTLVTADAQTAGRGRHGRRWSAPPRSALLMSLLLRWRNPGATPALLPLLAAVAVCDLVGPQALVKWPNDVVLSSGDVPGKLAGILIEGRPQQRWLVLGIGLNVAVDPADLPEEVQSTAATMGRSSQEIESTLRALLAALERRLAQPDREILDAWRGRDALLGRPVARQGVSGIAEGITDRGALRVRQHDGSLLELDSGEVTASFGATRGAT